MSSSAGALPPIGAFRYEKPASLLRPEPKHALASALARTTSLYQSPSGFPPLLSYPAPFFFLPLTALPPSYATGDDEEDTASETESDASTIASSSTSSRRTTSSAATSVASRASKSSSLVSPALPTRPSAPPIAAARRATRYIYSEGETHVVSGGVMLGLPSAASANASASGSAPTSSTSRSAFGGAHPVGSRTAKLNPSPAAGVIRRPSDSTLKQTQPSRPGTRSGAGVAASAGADAANWRRRPMPARASSA
ncbi:hypothetical protein MKEN_00003000 [Mycena kentingensis (nom. inval.)]|nr:hypothetical protein MKEN_00003000 [Mycena kentingensis (nom. inval.)]